MYIYTKYLRKCNIVYTRDDRRCRPKCDCCRRKKKKHTIYKNKPIYIYTKKNKKYIYIINNPKK